MGNKTYPDIKKYLNTEIKEEDRDGDLCERKLKDLEEIRGEDLEGVFLILKDFESGNNIYTGGTTTNLIPKSAPKTNYIRYYSSGEMLISMKGDLTLLTQYRNDINLSKFIKYLGTEEIEKMKMQQYYKARTVAFINKITTECRVISIAIIRRGGRYYGMRKEEEYSKDNEKMPKLMLTYMLKRLEVEEDVDIQIDYLTSGYMTTMENLPFVKEIGISVPGTKSKGSYEKEIYNHYMLTGKSLIPMEIYK